MRTDDGILMIEPVGKPSATPLIDELTRKMTAAWRRRRDALTGYRGMHSCVCGAISDNKDHWVDDLLTNSLCVHYLAFHRDDVLSQELDKVRVLAYGEADPDDRELLGQSWVVGKGDGAIGPIAAEAAVMKKLRRIG